MSSSDKVFGAQIQGDRKFQEDAFQIEKRDEGVLLVLCDGMGGHSGGNQASKLAIATFIDSFFSTSDSLTSRLRAGVEEANNRILQAGVENPELNKMGTTLLAVFVQNSQINWISVGDSPLWLIRGGNIQRLNANHSLAAVFEEMVKTGHMSAEDAATDPNRHSLRSSLSGDEIKLIDERETPFELQVGDCLLLASDGLETLPEQKILDLWQSEPDRYIEMLLDAVEQAGKENQDNTSALCYLLGQTETTN
ncbi:MAG: serine/threonine-protein phosphatase [Porticoccaceae bacterium]|jgi:PPM family protein phosphatase|nr:serine/threonine-protein phosphatase [Porticoccaceae bacterium]